MFELTLDRSRSSMRSASPPARSARLAAHPARSSSITTRVADVATTAIPPADLDPRRHACSTSCPSRRAAAARRARARRARRRRRRRSSSSPRCARPRARSTSCATPARRRRAHVFAPCTRHGRAVPDAREPRRLVPRGSRASSCRRAPPSSRGSPTCATAASSSATSCCASSRCRSSTVPSAWRVVCAPFIAKGKLEVFGCSDAGRVPLRLLKRNRSEANRAFERASRGDVLAATETLLRQGPRRAASTPRSSGPSQRRR